MHCVVNGGRRYSADLPQGGMDIPCKLHSEGKSKEISKSRDISRMNILLNVYWHIQIARECDKYMQESLPS